MAILLELYNFSIKLQAQFPEVLKHDFTRLLSWASEVTADGSKNIDADKERLSPYRDYYKNSLNPLKTGFIPVRCSP